MFADFGRVEIESPVPVLLILKIILRAHTNYRYYFIG